MKTQVTYELHKTSGSGTNGLKTSRSGGYVYLENAPKTLSQLGAQAHTFTIKSHSFHFLLLTFHCRLRRRRFAWRP